MSIVDSIPESVLLVDLCLLFRIHTQKAAELDRAQGLWLMYGETVTQAAR
jgi:hypothetical protein